MRSLYPRLFVLLAVLIVVEAHPHVHVGDNGGYEFVLNSSVYLIGAERLRFVDASFHCLRWGGNLTTISDQESREAVNYLVGQDPFYTTYWVGVLSDGALEAMNNLTSDQRLYTNCTASPEQCAFNTAGPFVTQSVVSSNCLGTNGACSFTKWTNIHGADVTSIPWDFNEPSGGFRCVAIGGVNCDTGIGGCQSLRAINFGCFQRSRRFSFICKKPSCPATMQRPNSTNVAFSAAAFVWFDFFGAFPSCGAYDVRYFANKCSMDYVDLRDLRIESSNGVCRAGGRNNNTVVVPLGGGRCTTGRTLLPAGSGFNIIYSYSIKAYLGSAKAPASGDVVRRDRTIQINFNCTYTNFAFGESNVFTTLGSKRTITHSARHGNVVVSMALFSDVAFSVPITGNPPTVNVPNMIYFLITSSKTDAVLQAMDCWASTSSDYNSLDNRYNLLQHGCRTDPELMVLMNHAGPQVRFAFPSFVYTSSSRSDIYFHCGLVLCTTGGCVNPCSGRRKRNVRTYDHKVSMGPIIFMDKTPEKKQEYEQLKKKYKTCTESNGGCSHGCVEVSGRGVLCDCPAQMELARNGKNCVNSEVPETRPNGDQTATIDTYSTSDVWYLVGSVVLIISSVVVLSAARCRKVSKRKELRMEDQL